MRVIFHVIGTTERLGEGGGSTDLLFRKGEDDVTAWEKSPATPAARFTGGPKVNVKSSGKRKGGERGYAAGGKKRDRWKLLLARKKRTRQRILKGGHQSGLKRWAEGKGGLKEVEKRVGA